MSEFHHVSVLLEECIEALNIKPDGIYVDGTLGGAGHSSRIAAELTTGRLIGIDRDPVALEAAGERLKPFADRVTLVHSNFDEMDTVLKDLGISGVDGILMDLGVSSPQLDDGKRGFSYMADAPLDMRMNSEDTLDARQIVNGWSYEELKRILYDYGEERYAPRIAAAICKRREEAPIETTLELVDIIRGAMPAAALREKQHPAKRSFQAIRIAVNDELGSVERVMKRAVPCLNPGGRLAVITFHSLEDRIVKNAMAEAAKGCICPREFPVCVCGRKPQVKIITRKPITSTEISLDPVAIGGILVSLMLLAVMIVGALQLKTDWANYRVMDSYVSRLSSQNAKLTEEYRSQYDLDDIRSKAQALGMVPREELQTRSVYVTVPQPEPEPTWWENLQWFLEGLFA